jgi:radical SAM protein with 4Fe4S-binding SPASM domain
MISEIKYKTLSKRLNLAASKERFPVRAIFELTYRCNYRCVHCYLGKKKSASFSKKELNTKEVFNILDQLEEIGCFTLGLTGGEVFLRKDIFDILDYAKRRGFNIAVLTNGSLLSEAFIDRLKELKLNKIDITLNSLNADTFDRITKSAGFLPKVMASLNYLYKRKVPFSLKTNCMVLNRDEVVSISRFANTFGVAHRINYQLSPTLSGSLNTYKHRIGFREFDKIHQACYPQMYTLTKGNTNKKNNSILARRDTNRVFNCSAGETSLTINPFGELKLCIEIDYPKYNILKGNLKKGWDVLKGIVDAENKRILKKCNSCRLIKFCSWCPAKSWAENKNFIPCPNSWRKDTEDIRKLQ